LNAPSTTAPIGCPGCNNTRFGEDGWCDQCAPSWIRIARCARDLRNIRNAGRSIEPTSAAMIFARIRHRIDDDELVKVLAELAPRVAPEPVMPRLVRVVRARRRGAVGPWTWEPRAAEGRAA
jgi:hypothetical protein